jgi:hypothetical protein
MSIPASMRDRLAPLVRGLLCPGRSCQDVGAPGRLFTVDAEARIYPGDHDGAAAYRVKLVNQRVGL